MEGRPLLAPQPAALLPDLWAPGVVAATVACGSEQIGLLVEGLALGLGAPSHTHTDGLGAELPLVPPLPCQGGPGGSLLSYPSLIPLPCSHASSEEWQQVSKSEREKMGMTVQDDGEFW